MFITEDPTLAATGSGKARGFSDLTSLGRVFPSDSEPYKAALAFFGREDGYPLGLFTVGRWVRNDIGSELQGTTVRSLTNRPNKVTVGFSTGSGATAGRPSVTSGGITSVPIGYRITVTDAGSGYSVAPAVTITGPTGASATATLNASGGVESIAVTDYGHGYSSAPTISVAAPGGGGTRATATAAFAPGSGYSRPPSVTVRSTGGGQDAVVDAVINAAGVLTGFNVVTAGTGYTPATTEIVLTDPPGNGAVGTAVVNPDGTITGVSMRNNGNGYDAPPRVTFTDDNGTGAAGRAVIEDDGVDEVVMAPTGQVLAVYITNVGSGYSSPPTVTFSAAPPGGVTATGTATVANGRITGIVMTNRGTGYTSAPTVTIDGTGTAVATVVAAGSGYQNTAELEFHIQPRTRGAESLDIDVTFNANGTAWNDVAGQLQTALRALTNDGGAFDNAVVRYIEPPAGAPEGTPGTMSIQVLYSNGDFDNAVTGDDAEFFGLDDATFARGGQQETLAAAMTAIEAAAGEFAYMGADNEIAEDETSAVALVRWAATNQKMLGLGFTGPEALLATDTTSVLNAVSGERSRYVFGVWNDQHDYGEWSIIGAFAAVRWDGARTLLDAKFIRPYRITANTSLTKAQRDVLVSKRCNFFTTFGSTPIFAEGQTFAPGYWLDTQIWLQWFLNAVQTDVFNAFVNSRRIPMTDDGRAVLEDTVIGVCEQGILNGGIGVGGSVQPITATQIRSITENLAFDGTLAPGYLIWVAPLEQISASSRQTRQFPPVRVWITGSGAIHFASFDIVLEE